MNFESTHNNAQFSPVDDPKLPVFTSGELFGSHQQVRIVHDGATYLLRITRSGKLILTK